MKTLLLLAIGCTILFHAFSQATGDYRSKATGDWNAASSWERFDGTSWVAAVVAPSSTDGIITIQNGHTITNTTAVTVDQLDVEGLLVQNSTMNIANGTGDDIAINGYGSIEFRGSGTTIQSNATCVINAIEIKLFSTVTNNGTVDWNSGYFSFDGGTFINNKNFNAAANAPMYRYSGGGAFTNASTGVFTRLTSISTLDQQVTFTNNGTMNFNTGTFQNHGGFASFTNTGALNFAGGSFENAGNGYFNSGTTMTGTGSFIQDEDTLQLNTALTIPSTISFTFSNLLINGTGSISLPDSMVWTGGVLAVPLTIQTGGTLILNGPGIVLKSTCTNNGTINWNSGDFSFDGGTCLNNKTFNAAADAQLYKYPGDGTFTNSSTGVFTRLTGVLGIGLGINFINNGVMNFQTGTFHNACCSGRFTNTGTLNFSGGATFQNSADAFFNAGTKITGNGVFTQDFDTMRVNLALSVPSHVALKISGGVVNGSGSLKLNGSTSWDGGVLALPTTVQASGTMAFNSGEVILNTTLTNNGIVNWNNGYFSFSNGKFVNNNIFNITSNNQTFNYGGGSITNGAKGIFSKTSTGTTSMNMGSAMPITNNGTIKGVGTYEFGTNLTNKGKFAPGNSIGILTTGTNFTNNKLQIEMHDAGGVGVGNDELLVNGDAHIKDTLEIQLTGTVPMGNYTILSCTGSLSGTFNTLRAPAGFTVGKSGKNLFVHVPLPGVSVNDTSVVEGNSGSKLMKFIVRLAFPSNLASSVDYQTHDSTAKVPKDYVAKTGTLNFTPGQLADTISVSIKGDTISEPDELFYIRLLNPVNLVIAKDTGIGTIVNNDAGPLVTGQQVIPGEISTVNNLVIPNLLHRGQAWKITGLSGLDNSVALIDTKGTVVYKSTNQNIFNLAKLVPGLYFYQVLVNDNSAKLKSYTGKLVITE